MPRAPRASCSRTPIATARCARLRALHVGPPSRTRVYDNAAEFAADIPTYAHHLRNLGYAPAVRQDAFRRARPAARFRRAVDHRHLPSRFRLDAELGPSWPLEVVPQHELVNAGLAEATNQLDFDDEVVLRVRVRDLDGARHRPAAVVLTVSFTHPHDPYVIATDIWDLYDHDAIDIPAPADRRR